MVIPDLKGLEGGVYFIVCFINFMYVSQVSCFRNIFTCNIIHWSIIRY